ncbi:MAG TPA: fibronectin type III domain-containing protein [Roseiflexaceae bacterium]|nr:fibronectin type III domain-containing protein [Roseiflexaceae bacterium]
MPKALLTNFNLPGTGVGIPEDAGSIAADAAPAAGFLPAPQNVVASAGPLAYSQVTPRAYLNVTWDAPADITPERYEVAYANDSAFSSQEIIPALTTSASIALPCARLYYVRVRALVAGSSSDWSDVASATTAIDTTPPSAPADFVVAFADTGDLALAFTPSGSANYLDTEVAIYSDSSMALELARFQNRAGRATWTAAQNRAAGAGSPDPAVYVRLRSRSVSGYYSAWVAASATKARPAAPGSPTVTWDAASGTATWAWSPVADGVRYQLVIDGKTYTVTDTTFVYTAARNRLDHSGTAVAALPWALSTVDALDQTTLTPASGTATLARPATPTGVTVTWDAVAGTARWSWTPVAGAASYQLVIDGKTYTVADSTFTYTPAQNRLDHGGTASAALSWSVVAVDGLGQTSTTPASGTATLARPATPTGVTHSWSGDTGTAGTTWLISWSAVAGAAGYQLTIDGKTYVLADTSAAYDLARNRDDHSGTPDPVLSWSVVAVDGLGQTSATPASGTATNAAPAAPGVTVSPGFTTLGITISGALPQDLRDYTVRIYRNGGGSPVATFTSLGQIASWQETSGGQYTYQVGVIANDQFGQASSETLSSTVALDVETMAGLRADVRYRNSLGSSAAALDLLKDDDRSTSAVTYPSGSTWHWTEAERPLLERVQNITVAANAGQGYVGISNDGSTYAWYSGPLASDGRTLQLVASEAAAQAAAVTLPTDGVLALPGLREARFVRLGHRNVGGTYNLREFYPVSTIIADMIRAGAITALHIAAATITGDKLFGTELSALKSNLGSVTISGICSIGSSGGIYQGFGSFASPDTGLKIYSTAGGVGIWEAWGSGVKQAYMGTDGALYAGAGSVSLSATGLRMIPYSGSTPNTQSYLAWVRAGTTDPTAWAAASYNAGTGISGSGDSTMHVRAYAGNVGGSLIPYQTELRLSASSDTNTPTIGQGEATIRLVAVRPGSAPNDPYIALGVRTTNVNATNAEQMMRIGRAGVWINNSSSAPTLRATLDVAGSGLFDGNVSIGGNVLLFGFINGSGLGTHPLYTSPAGKIAWWKEGSDYSMLTDGTDTIINAPLTTGVVRIKGGNTGSLGGDRARIDASGNLAVAGTGTFSGHVMAGAQARPTLGGGTLFCQLYGLTTVPKATAAATNVMALMSSDAADPFGLVVYLATSPTAGSRSVGLTVRDGAGLGRLAIAPTGGTVEICGNSSQVLSFFGGGGASQYSSVARTAGGSYSSNEQAMLQTLWSMVVGYGQLRIV